MTLTIKQTDFLRKCGEGLENLIRISIDDLPHDRADLYVNGAPISADAVHTEKHENGYSLTAGYWSCEAGDGASLTVEAVCGEERISETASLRTPKHYVIHLTHHSHHDPGYTDIMSHVFQRHYEWIDTILDEMDRREHYPDDVRLRITIEQFWSLDYFLGHAPADRIEKLKERVRRGDIELTALYGNMISEQLGHEECYRLMQPAHAFAKECGVSVRVAMHNDIPGISWGLCRALCDAGIPYLNADLPLYYNWGYSGIVSFWDCTQAYGYNGPGMCRWKAPDGKSILLWNPACFGIGDLTEQGVESFLDGLAACGYPYTNIKVGCNSSNIDNSCYSPMFADFAAEWNRTYAYPRIVTSTNAQFFDRILREADDNNIAIPEIRGEMPGQDYPIAAMSMAQITSTALRTQQKAVVAEKLLAVTDYDPVVRDQTALLKETWRDLLLSDDHAYGSQFPAGPAMRASYWEKGTYAMRAEANTHDLADKAIASIADRIDADGTDLRLVVFNPGGTRVNSPVETLLREWDNCGTILGQNNHDPDKLKGYILNDRRRVNPDESVWRDGKFKLIDMESGEEIPYEITDLLWDDPEYYAPESCGLGSGTARYGFFEVPGGMKRVLRFTAKNLPPFGYRCYAIVRDEASFVAEPAKKTDVIDNGIYRIRTDSRGIASVIDCRSGRELLDLSCEHRLGDILVRTGSDPAASVMHVTGVSAEQNSIAGTVTVTAEADGIHEIKLCVRLFRDIDRIDVSLHMLRGAKPLQSVFMAFPFVGEGFRYQGVLSEMEPGVDIVPGGQSDFLAVKDYVHVKGSDVLWSSRDTAVASLGALWGGYISPAHRCVMKPEHHTPLTADAFGGGKIYAMLSANNFGTNFMCSQVFDGVYKFSFAAKHGADDAACAAWGECVQNPVITQFTDRSRGNEAPSGSLFDTGELHCISLCKTEGGYLARIWNHSDTAKPLTIRFRGQEIGEFVFCNALGEETGSCPGQTIPPRTVCTVRFSK